MYRRLALFLFVVLCSLWPRFGPAMAPDADPPGACDAAAEAAERSHRLPAGILAAIGRVESGRIDPADRAHGFAPWPWTVNAAGAGSFLPSAAAAVDTVQSLHQRGLRNIDVGCFQVNLEQHPDAFATLAAAFDPRINADYAAGFLSALHERTGSWEAAVAAYHSATPERGIPYRGLVFARWADLPSPSEATPAPRPGTPVVIAGVRIWTPSAPGTAPTAVHIETSPGPPPRASPIP